jgi:hypothetical protein
MSQFPQGKIRRSRNDWERLMAEYEAGAVTQRAFCDQHELAYSTFSYWRKRLCQTVTSSAQSEPLFELPTLPLDRGDEWRVELDLGQGVTLRLR